MRPRPLSSRGHCNCKAKGKPAGPRWVRQDLTGVHIDFWWTTHAHVMESNASRIKAIVDRANMNKRDVRGTMDSNSKSVTIDLGNHAQGINGSKMSGTGGEPQATEELMVLCINLKALPRTLQFCVCAGGVFFFYLIYGYFQVSNPMDHCH